MTDATETLLIPEPSDLGLNEAIFTDPSSPLKLWKLKKKVPYVMM